MSRRKQTKPFKVEDKEPEAKKERKVTNRRSSAREIESPDVPNDQDISDEVAEEEVEEGVTRPGRRSVVKCDECGKSLASSLSLARHKLTHSENKPYRCPHCNAGFKTNSNMHRHVRIHFREEYKDRPDESQTKPHSIANKIRSSRQNIRTPNKFREFDVDLVGVSSRTLSDTSATRLQQRSKIVKEVSDVESTKSLDDQSSPEDLDNISESEPESESATKNEDLACHVCNKTFISKFGRVTHMAIHSENAGDSSATSCNLCDQTFSSRKGLMMHNVVEHKVTAGKTQVKSQDDVFSKMAEMDFSAKMFPYLAEKVCVNAKRVVCEAGDHQFLCKRCNVAFPLLESLRLHIVLKHAVKADEKVDATVFSIVNLVDKREQAAKPPQNNTEVSNGEDNDDIYSSKLLSIKQIPEWLQDSPVLDPSAYDKVCEEVTPYASKLDLTYDGEATPIKNFENDTSKSGLEDSLQMSSKVGGKKKMKSHLDPSVILRRFEHPSNHKIDIDRMAMDKNVFWCRICNYSSHEKSALIRHLLTHSGIRPYFCKLCDYAFTTKANCERHVRKRHNITERKELDTAVKCDWELLKKAPREDIYMISASNSSCPVCQKSFSCNVDLKQHMKIHEERHFVCQLCAVRCTTRNNCVRHIMHKHPGIPHQEANNIITFCGNGQNELNLDIEAMTTDTAAEPTGDVDLSRGRLGVRSTTRQTPRWKRPGFARRSSFRQPESKRPRTVDVSSPRNTHEEDAGDSAVPERMENSSHAGNNTRPKKMIPLIPLLKIKAYNEAAANSYAQMVALYSQLNFLNPIQPDGNLLNVSAALNETADTSADMTDGEVYLASETTFVCHTCAKAFDTKELLQDHIPQCEYNASNDTEDLQNTSADYTDLPDDSEHRDDVGSKRNGSIFNGENTEWSRDVEISQEEDDDNESKHRETESWQKNASYVSQQNDETVPEYDSAYSSDGKQRGSTYGKEPSYVEDSLLQSMFGEGDNNPETDTTSNTSLSIARYSPGLPTMVDMPSGSIPVSKYQGSLDLEDKFKNKAFHGRKCPQCNKTFPWASSLRRHIMTHTGLKLYMCRVCEMRFTTRSNLIRHVYRRHGMAKQHPEFAACLAKLNPSDSLLREVEADVRRRIDVKRKRIPGTRNAYERRGSGEEAERGDSVGTVKFGNFQSMLEDDPDTMLVDLDYSPRDEMNEVGDGKQLSLDHESESQEGEDIENDEDDVEISVKEEPRAISSARDGDSINGENESGDSKNENVDDAGGEEKNDDETKSLVKPSRNKQSSHFVCGLCKKIFKNVEQLIRHQHVHNVPHCWHCPVCRVPFTNKYNCQRHLSRRHDRTDVEPKYIEDVKHGPRNARGMPRSARSSPDWRPKKSTVHAV